MYEFVETATGWLVCWGPPPRAADPTTSQPKTPPSLGERTAVPASVEPHTRPGPAAPVAAGR